MKDKLEVRIPKRFKKQLIARFSFSNAKLSGGKVYYEIRLLCPLCEDHLQLSKYRLYSSGIEREYDCGCCPFNRFNTSKLPGCVWWLHTITAIRPIALSDRVIAWPKKENTLVKYLLRELKIKAKKYIMWV